MNNLKSILLALAGLVCGAAGGIAATAPVGPVQRAAADVSAVCSATGLNAQPRSTLASEPAPEPNPGPVPPGGAPTDPDWGRHNPPEPEPNPGPVPPGPVGPPPGGFGLAHQRA